LTIYDEIKQEMDGEAEQILQEYERSFNFPAENGGQLENDIECSSSKTLEGAMLSCAMCGNRNNYNVPESLSSENRETESFCDCGRLLVDRKTKVLEPLISKGEIIWRLNETTTRHALHCAASAIVGTVDGGINDGNQLIVSCQACGLQLVIW